MVMYLDSMDMVPERVRVLRKKRAGVGKAYLAYKTDTKRQKKQRKV
jgi:hypothetical protein